MSDSRLFHILYYLLNKERATAPELAEKFEVSQRTIYRDIEALSGAGIPVYAEPGRNGGISLLQDFVLDRALLSRQEKQEILTALQSIHSVQNMGSSETLQKLSALFRLSSQNWLEVDFSRWGSRESDNKKFELLKSAVIHKKCMQIRYASSYEAISERVVHPYKLVYKARAWYLQAFCTVRQDWRTFRCNRILDLQILNESFPHREFPKSAESYEGKADQITLRFPKEMTYRVYDEFDETQIQRQDNGDLIVSARMSADKWLVGFLLSFGTQVDVLSPAHLKNALAQQARLIYEKNKP